MRDRVAPTATVLALALVVMIVAAGGRVVAAPRAVAQDATPVAAEGFRPTHAVNTPQSLNLRARPTMSSPILAALAPRTPVAFLGEAVDQAGGETWLNVATANGLVGWVRGFDLDPIDEADTSGSHATTSPQGPALAADPVVGSWSERRNRGDHLTFFADGNVLLTDADGQTYHGAWQRVDRPGLIGTYVVEAWRRDGGEGRLGPIVRVSADELDLGNAVYDRLIPPTPADLGLPGGAGVSATPTPPEAPPGGVDAEPGASPGATPVADEAAAADDPFPGVAVEDLANIAHLPGRLVLGQVSLTRVTMQPGAVFAYTLSGK